MTLTPGDRRQRPGAPVRRSGGHRRRGQLHDALDYAGTDTRLPARSRGIPLNPGQPLVGKPRPPAAHAFPVGLQRLGNHTVLESRCRSQHDLGAQDQPGGRPASTRPAAQLLLFLWGQGNRHGYTHRLVLLQEDSTRLNMINHHIYDTLH